MGDIMKLAEALILRTDLKKKIESLNDRIQNNIKVQDGEQPSENPYDLIEDLNENLIKQADIIKRINKTNNTTDLEDGVKLSDALTERDMLREKVEYLTAIANEATVKFDRYSKSEIRFVSVMDVKDLQKKIDLTSKELRELDIKIQGMNWITDLI